VWQLRWIATYSRQLGAPPNTQHPKSQYAITAETRHLWRQSFVVTEFMSAGSNNYCLDCRHRNQLRCLKSLTKCHKHYIRAHVLWCEVKRDSLLRNNITYLTCDGSCFHVTTLTFDLMTFNICSASAVTWQNHVPNFRKTKKSTAEFTGIILHVGLARTYLGSLQPSPRRSGQI